MAVFQQILSEEQAKTITEWLDGDPEGWSEKPVTGPTDPTIKHCQEYSGRYYHKIQEAVFAGLDKSHLWHNYTVLPKQSSVILINRYKEGNFYREHNDKNINGTLGAYHYSNTLFVNSPDTYEGGELVIVKDEEEHSYKLNAGDLVTYPTGAPHRVQDVTEGVRYSIVFWTESYIYDPVDRERLRALNKAYKHLDELLLGLPQHKLKESRTLERALSSIEEAIISKYHVVRRL